MHMSLFVVFVWLSHWEPILNTYHRNWFVQEYMDDYNRRLQKSKNETEKKVTDTNLCLQLIMHKQ